MQLPHIFLVDAQLGEELLRVAHRNVAIDHFYRRSAFDDGAVEESLGRGHRQQSLHLPPAAGLAEDGHRVRIAPKLSDVRAHPFQRLNDIQHADVAGGREIRLNSLKFAKPRTLRRWLMVTTTTSPRRARFVPSLSGDDPEPVANPPPWHQNITGRLRPFAAAGPRRRPNIEHQAIFALGRQIFARDRRATCRRWRGGRITLRRAGSVGKSIAHAGPIRRFGGRHEAVRARRTRSVRDAFENFDAVVVDAANFA